MASYGGQLREARKGRALRQKDIAARCGISQQYLCDLEHDRRLPSAAVERALHAATGVGCDAFPDRAFLAGYRYGRDAGDGVECLTAGEALRVWRANGAGGAG